MKMWSKLLKVLKYVELTIYRSAKIIFALWVIYQALFGNYSMAQVLEWFK